MAGDLDVLFKSFSKIMKSHKAIGDGPHLPFNTETFKQKMTDSGSYRGSACNIMVLDLNKMVFANVGVNMTDVKSNAVRIATSSFQSDTRFEVLKVTVACNDIESPGEFGTWRKLSMDLQCWSIAFIIVDATAHPKNYPDLTVARAISTACHHPVDFELFTDIANFTSATLLRSFQLLETLKTDEETYAPSGYEVAQVYAQARDIIKGRDGNIKEDSLRDLFSGIKWAKQSDYKLDSSRTASDLMRMYDRMEEAGCGPLISDCRSKFSKSSCFYQTSKLNVIAASGSDDPDRLKFIVDLLYVRMLRGVMDEDTTSKSSLMKVTLPHVNCIYDIQRYIGATLKYTGASKFATDLQVLGKLKSPLDWDVMLPMGNADARKVLLAVKKPTLNLVHLVDGLYSGSQEGSAKRCAALHRKHLLKSASFIQNWLSKRPSMSTTKSWMNTHKGITTCKYLTQCPLAHPPPLMVEMMCETYKIILPMYLRRSA